MRKKELKIIKKQNFDEERSLYMISNTRLVDCNFEGPLDGESPLKDAKNIEIENCKFELRYPLWRTYDTKVRNTLFSENCRAPFWYNKKFNIENSKIYSIKSFRECYELYINKNEIISNEAFWKCNKVKIDDTELKSEYPFFECQYLIINNLKMNAKYSFQYCNNIIIKNSYLNTKDAFWHSKNIIIYDSIVEGEYLAWYAKNIKFIRCKIIGTQPFCETKNLILKDCVMTNTDLSFELSTVKGNVNSEILSIKSPKCCKLICDEVKELIIDQTLVNPKKTKITRRIMN